ncbi:MAG TPA: D-alanyl-D-alanine carboxypeptidase family protein [Candidatus Paceibacterota bacterium]|nr:D-alanyl-D-alanine carboxypeptidase family protein [Candidatus Paceibacterota bacterium]
MKRNLTKKVGFGILILVVILGIVYLGYKAYFLNTENKTLKSKLEELNSITISLNEKIKENEQQLQNKEKENKDLLEALNSEKDKNSYFESQINSISQTVGKLEKLNILDPELLKKYSKVYFLNENYVPVLLSFIPKEYLANQNKPLQIHSQVLPYLEKLMTDSNSSGLNLKIASAYRSFYDQINIKNNYVMQFGTTVSNSFSADQGYSEHQLGTTIDFTTNELNGSFLGFEKTPEYQWLLENAYKYGFVLSYPKDNKYYQFEPWHWRFVGVKLATDLHSNNQYFYDLDQREIDQYLISIFD